jgi:hypothetical protein
LSNAIDLGVHVRIFLLAALSLSSCTNAARSEPTKQTPPVVEVAEPAKPVVVTEPVKTAQPSSATGVAVLTPINESNHLELHGGDASSPVDIGQGRKAYRFGTIFMKNSLSKATVPVNLHMRGVTVEPNSEAEVYFADQQGHFIPSALIGSITGVAGGPTTFVEIVREVKDFEAAGKKYNARTELRNTAHFGLVLVVLKGRVKVDKFILSTPADGK